MQELQAECLDTAKRANLAARQLGALSSATKDGWLLDCADSIIRAKTEILDANRCDLDAAPGFGLTPAAIDRLRLTASGIESLASSLRQLASLRDPVGEIIEGYVRPNGLEVQKVRVPLGTIFFIYESRPNVTVDAAGICVKSGNSVILRGGKEAVHSSKVLVDLMRAAASRHQIPVDAVQLLASQDRQAVGCLLAMNDFIDVVIPRGGKGLIERVVQEARMPVIKHFDGNCHVYLDADADAKMAVEIVVNSKCQRLGVCNACESLLVHRDVASTLLPSVAKSLLQQGIEIRGDTAVCKIVPEAIPATEEDFAAEYLAPIISVCVVADLDAAITHINRYSSHHTDAIVTNNLAAARRFQALVDSSAVIVNASTRFNDGGELGLGAEIGISTDKLHARGPCGLRELTTYKYLVVGAGQVRQ